MLGQLGFDGVECLAEFILNIELCGKQPLLHGLGYNGANLWIARELGGVILHEVEVGRQVKIEVVDRAKLGHLTRELAFWCNELLGFKLMTQITLVSVGLLRLAALDGTTADDLAAIEEGICACVEELQGAALRDHAALMQTVDDLGGYLLMDGGCGLESRSRHRYRS